MRAAERLSFIIFCLISAAICAAIYVSQASYAVVDTLALGLRGTISATSSDERRASTGAIARQPSLDETEIAERLAKTRTTGDILETYATLRRKSELFLDAMGINQLNARFARELDSRQEQFAKDALARTALLNAIISVAAVLVTSIGVSGTWFGGYINYKNYLHTIAKDAAVAMIAPSYLTNDRKIWYNPPMDKVLKSSIAEKRQSFSSRDEKLRALRVEIDKSARSLDAG